MEKEKNDFVKVHQHKIDVKAYVRDIKGIDFETGDLIETVEKLLERSDEKSIEKATKILQMIPNEEKKNEILEKVTTKLLDENRLDGFEDYFIKAFSKENVLLSVVKRITDKYINEGKFTEAKHVVMVSGIPADESVKILKEILFESLNAGDFETAHQIKGIIEDLVRKIY